MENNKVNADLVALGSRKWGVDVSYKMAFFAQIRLFFGNAHSPLATSH